MSTADHATCCCAETINDLRALNAAYKAALHGITAANRVNEELAHRLTEAIAERDRARDTAARLEAEIARGFRTAPPDITLTRTDNGAPETPDEAENSDRIVQIRPKSGKTPPGTFDRILEAIAKRDRARASIEEELARGFRP